MQDAPHTHSHCSTWFTDGEPGRSRKHSRLPSSVSFQHFITRVTQEERNHIANKEPEGCICIKLQLGRALKLLILEPLK